MGKANVGVGENARWQVIAQTELRAYGRMLTNKSNDGGKTMGKEKNKYLGAIFIALFSEILFGLSFIFIKMCVSSISIFTLLSWRGLTAFAAMTVCALLGIIKIDLKGKNLRPLLLLSFFQPISYFVMETMGIRLTTASESGTILACVPIITMLFSTIFLKDKPTKRQVFFMMMSVTGAVIIGLLGGFQASSNVLGYLFIVGAMCSESAYAITSQKLKGFNSAEKTYAMVASGAVVFTGCALVEHGIKGTLVYYLTLPFTDSNFLICILYLSLGCSVIAFFCANYSISIIGATRRAAFAGLATVTAIIGGVFYLGESFTMMQAVAAVLIMAGAYGVNRSGSRE